MYVVWNISRIVFHHSYLYVGHYNFSDTNGGFMNYGGVRCTQPYIKYT